MLICRFGFNQFIIDDALLKVGILYSYADAVSKAVEPARATADNPVMLFVKLKEIASDLAQRNHTFYVCLIDFHVHSPLGKTGNGTFVLLTYLVLHILNELVFYARSFGICCNLLTQGSIGAFALIVVLLLALGARQIQSKQAMYHQVRVTAYR